MKLVNLVGFIINKIDVSSYLSDKCSSKTHLKVVLKSQVFILKSHSDMHGTLNAGALRTPEHGTVL